MKRVELLHFDPNKGLRLEFDDHTSTWLKIEEIVVAEASPKPPKVTKSTPAPPSPALAPPIPGDPPVGIVQHPKPAPSPTPEPAEDPYAFEV